MNAFGDLRKLFEGLVDQNARTLKINVTGSLPWEELEVILLTESPQMYS
jgi:hypothetical protein